MAFLSGSASGGRQASRPSIPVRSTVVTLQSGQRAIERSCPQKPKIDARSTGIGARSAPTKAASRSVRLGWKLPPRLPESRGDSLYVSASGSDAWRCVRTRSCRTLEKAFRLACPGTTIYLRGGTYAGEIWLTSRYFGSTDPVTITNYPGERAVLTGDPTPAFYGKPALVMLGVDGVRVRGLEIANPNGHGIIVRDSSHVDLARLYLHDNAIQGVLVEGQTNQLAAQTYSSDVQIWNSIFTNNGGRYPGDETFADKGDHAIYYGAGPDAPDGMQHGTIGGTIANNLIYDQSTGRGIQLGQSAVGTIVTNNTIYRTDSPNQYAGQPIIVWNKGSSDFPSRDVVIVNNLLTYGSGEAVYGSCGVDMETNFVDHNLSYGNARGDFLATAGSCQLFTLGTRNITGQAPLYVDARKGDFHLQRGSPALRTANPAYAPPIDLDGRPRSAAPAIGALGVLLTPGTLRGMRVRTEGFARAIGGASW